MSEIPSWLPDIISVDGNWDYVIGQLYSVFYKDFKSHRPFIRDLEVWYDKRVLPRDKYEEGFWHLITKLDRSSNERLLDNRRAERLPWCRPIIENNNDSVVKCWEILERGKKKIYVWLEEHDYVIVLVKETRGEKDVAFLITAYYVEGDSTRKKLQRKYQNRI